MKKKNMSRTTTSRKTLRSMTPEAIEVAACADSDAQPLTRRDLKRMKRTPQAKIIRRALGLTQEEFAAHYHIPLGILRDWEQGRAEPDQPRSLHSTDHRFAMICSGRDDRVRDRGNSGPTGRFFRPSWAGSFLSSRNRLTPELISHRSARSLGL
jgi:DNA-binding transcriptional regulator YiaG